MFLSEYLSDLTKAIDEYSKTGLIISSEVKIDFRTEKDRFNKRHDSIS